MTVTTYIGLGSNLGHSKKILQNAVKELATLGNIRVSKLYRTPPMGPQDQPDYLNAVVELCTELEPLKLLDALQRFEQSSGRVRLRHWGERTLDLDLLLYGNQHIKNERLTVPHVGLFERDFVVIPLLDLNPHFVCSDTTLNTLDIVKKSTLQPCENADWADEE